MDNMIFTSEVCGVVLIAPFDKISRPPCSTIRFIVFLSLFFRCFSPFSFYHRTFSLTTPSAPPAKARAWLEARGLPAEVRDIKTQNPTEAELRRWHALSGLPLKRFFNTSGLQYKALALKDKLPGMSEDEQFALLATDGMLVKRPILVGEDFVLVGFREAEWAARLG